MQFLCDSIQIKFVAYETFLPKKSIKSAKFTPRVNCTPRQDFTNYCTSFVRIGFKAIQSFKSQLITELTSFFSPQLARCELFFLCFRCYRTVGRETTEEIDVTTNTHVASPPRMSIENAFLNRPRNILTCSKIFESISYFFSVSFLSFFIQINQYV